MANVPETGPNPINITNNIAQIILGRLLKNANNILAGYEIQNGFKFLAANNEIGNEINIPKIVDTNAIFNVSVIPIHAVEHLKSKGGYSVHIGYICGSITLQSGGHNDSWKNIEILEKLFSSEPQSPSTKSLKVNQANIIIKLKKIIFLLFLI